MTHKYLIYATLALALVSCGRPGGDKKAELEKLKKQKADIEKKISELEKQVNDKGQAPKNVALVAAEQPKPGMFQHFIEVQARVDADQNIAVTPKVPGAQVMEVLVKRGDKVSEGQMLAKLDPGGLPQQIAALENQYDLARIAYEKQKSLWDQKIGTEMAFLQSKSNKQGLERQLAAMNQTLSNFTLRSPINGNVDDVNMKAGEMAAPGLSYIRVVNLSTVKVVADVSEAYVSKIQPGDEVKVFFPDLNKEIKTKVRTAAKVINAVNRTFTIEVPVNTSEVDAHPNMVAVVKVNDYTNPRVRTLPVNVVQNDDKGSFVYLAVAHDGFTQAEKKYVKTGENYAGRIEILSGLTEEDMVITEGYQNVVEGQPVNIQKV